MEGEQLWQKTLLIIKDQIGLTNYKAWFGQSKFCSLQGTTLTLFVSSAFIKNQLINRYQELILNTVHEISDLHVNLDFIIDSTQFLKKSKGEEETQGEEDIFEIQTNIQSPNINLNPKFTLENFVVGLTNNLAFAAAQAVSQNPGISYNPLFIYGPSGVGKTHLMQGIGNALIRRNPNFKLIYVSSERFMNDLVESIQTKRTGSFRQKYRNCNVFLIDDIQFISGKDSTQEEFFHTFNELQGKNAQIVMTSDRPPAEIQKLEARLASRFQGGLMVDIQLPDFDTRMAILKAKLQEKGDTLPEEILVMIAQAIESNTRELEGKLIQVLQVVKASPTPEIDMNVVRRYVGQPVEQSSKQSQRIDQTKVLLEINQYFSIKMEDLVGPRRQKELVLPRQIAMYILYKECGLPYEKIGEVLGGRDHTTIMHGVDKIEEVQNRDREIQRVLIEIKQHLVSSGV
jgi:chromosomal replication initiator protein